MMRDSFSEKVLLFMAKHEYEHLLHFWIRMLIDNNAGISAIKMVERAIYYHSKQAQRLKILKIVEDNPTWASDWINMIPKEKMEYFCSLLFNEEPYCFMIMNSLLQHYHFHSEKEFGDFLSQVGYEQQVDKFAALGEVRESVTALVRLMVE